MIVLAMISMFNSPNKKHQENPKMVEQIVISSKDSTDRDPIMYNKISFEGHTYIVFDIGGNKAGVTHDENCRCRRK